MKGSASTLSCVTLQYYNSSTPIKYTPRRIRCDNFETGLTYIVTNILTVGSRLYPFEVIDLINFAQAPPYAKNNPSIYGGNYFGYMFYLSEYYFFVNITNINTSTKSEFVKMYVGVYFDWVYANYTTTK